MIKTVQLGFEVGSGKPIAVPIRNMAVTGQTQESGKRLTTEQWSLLAGKSASGGWWNSAAKVIRDWDCIEQTDGAWAITAKGLALCDPLPPKISTIDELKRARYAAMPTASQRLFDAMTNAGATPEQIAKRAQLSMSGGYWNAALKGLRESGLVGEENGMFKPARETLTKAGQMERAA